MQDFDAPEEGEMLNKQDCHIPRMHAYKIDLSTLSISNRILIGQS
jgi:hypothetical protein